MADVIPKRYFHGPRMNRSDLQAGGVAPINIHGEQQLINKNCPARRDAHPVRGVPKTISFDSSTHSIGSLESAQQHSCCHSYTTGSQSEYSSGEAAPGYSSHVRNEVRRGPVRGISRSKSYEPHDPFTRNLEKSRPQDRGGKRDLVRGVARSKSYEASPYHECRSSRRPDANRIRHVSRSKSYDEHVRYGNERGHRHPEPVRGVPRSISYESDPIEDSRRNERVLSDRILTHSHHSGYENNSIINSRDRGRSSELSNSIHSFQSTGTESSYGEFAAGHIGAQQKRGFKRTSVKNKDVQNKDTKDEVDSVNDGQMDAYKAMVNASERTRKKKVNATSYVKITLGNGMAGYVKSVQQ